MIIIVTWTTNSTELCQIIQVYIRSNPATSKKQLNGYWKAVKEGVDI